MKMGINENISNEDYHADTEYISSSVLKVFLNPEKFHKKYVLKEKENHNQAALDFGTMAHLMLLEPHLFDSAYVIFDGPIRRGKVFDDFKNANSGKIILTPNEVDKLKALKHQFENNEDGPKLLENCLFEHTMCGELDGVAIKTRADAINVDSGYIVDVKTTSYEGDKDSFISTLFSLYYDLSAALYCTIARQIYGKSFDFYYIVLSKSSVSCNIYKTSGSTFEKGIHRLNHALKIYKNYLLTSEYKYESLDSEEDNKNIQEV